SPLDNYLLYGRTADIVAATKAGVTVSFGSDWSPYGSKNLLAELKVADKLNATQWGSFFSTRALVEMVTVNPARTIGWSGYVGSSAPGLYGDIVVFDATDAKDPYASIVRATDSNVQLVLIDGEPLYGDLDKMRLLKGDDCEVIYDQGGRKKAVDI